MNQEKLAADIFSKQQQQQQKKCNHDAQIGL